MGGGLTITRRLGSFRAIVLCAVDTLTNQDDPAGESQGCSCSVFCIKALEQN